MRGDPITLKISSMELVLVFLSMAIGTVVGVAAIDLYDAAQEPRQRGFRFDPPHATAEHGMGAGLGRTRRRRSAEAARGRQTEAQAARAELEGVQRRLLAAAAEAEKENAKRARAHSRAS